MGSVRDSVRSRCRDEQRRDAVPAPSAPPGGAQGARARNGAEMATAGLTDSAAPRAPPAPGTARDSPGQPGLLASPRPPQPQRSRWTRQFRGTQRTRGGIDSRHRGWPSRPRGRDCSPEKPPVAPPSPDSTSALSPVPNLFRLASRQREGCGRATPASGEGAPTPIPRPRPGGKSSGKVAYAPRTCLGGPFSAVAAQMSESLPLGPGVAPDQCRPRPPGSYC